MGVNLILFTKRIRYLPNLFRDYLLFKKTINIKTVFDPVIELNESSADLGEYFFQDLYVAKKLFKINQNSIMT